MNELSEVAVKALERIHTLRDITSKTGFLTRREQGEVLRSLPNKDALAVAGVLRAEQRRAR